MLLQYGASMEQDGYGMTPLLSASVTGHTNIVEYLTMHEQVRSPLTKAKYTWHDFWRLDYFPTARLSPSGGVTDCAASF